MNICNQETLLSKNGIITFVNGFSRAMRNILLEWKANFKLFKAKDDHLASLKQMREYDLALTFHIHTFNKLNKKIT